MYQWTEEQIALKNSIRPWAAKLNQGQKSHENQLDFAEKWAVIRQMGLLGLPVGAEHGGLGQDLLTTMFALEALGNVCEDEGLSFSVSSHIVSSCIPIQRFGSDEQKQTYLPTLCTGERIGAHAISESESGSDAWNMNTRAIKNEQGYRLKGSKTFTSNGPVADTFIVYARTNETAGTLGGFTAFIVDKSTPGFAQGAAMEKMGLHSSPICDLFFDDCQLSHAHVLGKEGQGFSIFNYVMKWEVLLSFIINVGEMERLLGKCVDYSKTRQQYGQPISKYQAISHKIADMKISVETARTMLYKAGQVVQKGGNSTVDLAIAKVITSESFVKCALDAIQIFGGNGYMQEFGIEKYLRNSVASKIYSGTSEIQRNTIASMLGL